MARAMSWSPPTGLRAICAPVVFVEVDRTPGTPAVTIAGAIKLDWRTDLQDRSNG